MRAISQDKTSSASTDYSSWQLIKRMLGLTWLYRWGCVKVVFLRLIQRGLAISGLAFMGLGIDYIRYQVNLGTKLPKWPLGLQPPETWNPMLVLGTVALAMITFASLQGVVTYTYTVEAARLTARQIVVDLRTRVYDKMQRLSFRFFDANTSGSLINRVSGDVQGVRQFIENVVMEFLSIALALILYLIYMFNIHMWLTVACLATTPLLWVLTTIFSRIVKPAYMYNRKLVDHMILVLAENLQGVHVVKGFARQDEEMKKFSLANEAVRKQKQKIFWRVSIFGPGIQLITQVNLVVLIGYGGYLVIRGDLQVGTGLLVFAGLLQQLSTEVGSIANIANSMQQSLVGAERVFEILDTPMEVANRENPIIVDRLKGSIEFRNVTFGYNPESPVLQDINLKVKPGQTVAILGATGAGKSTLLSLISRFYDPTQGQLLIDGVDARDYDLDCLRRNVGLVFQESFLFSNTVAANIAFGQPTATREQIETAARIASAHGFITGELPKGYDSVLGEGGVGLSGGQRQRLAIARAVLLEPPILLLDDPTAAIDPETEAEILEAMESAMRGRTTFVVAHRLSTLRRADLVIVLDHGSIVQVGRHEDLMAESGHYRHAANLQVADSESRKLLGVDGEVCS